MPLAPAVAGRTALQDRRIAGSGEGGGLRQPHPGARIHRCGCSLPGLTGFTVSRRGGTDADHHSERLPSGNRAKRVTKSPGPTQTGLIEGKRPGSIR